MLFVHIPKTGGTSIEDAFAEHGWHVDFLDRHAAPGLLNYYLHSSPQHMEASRLSNTFRLDRIDAVFGFVREPLARLTSEYVWRHWGKSEVDTSPEAFALWITSVLAAARESPFAYDNHIRPQVDFLLPGMHTLRFEDGLNVGMCRIRDVTGIDVPVVLPWEQNSTASTGVSGRDVAISSVVRKAVAEFYRDDYERFAYVPPDSSAAET
nr:sulfotransferase family 2 domain-containing protein [Demequina sp. NBRC 110051]